MNNDTRPERLDAIRKELYDIANSYSGDVTGDIAVAIHGACNRLARATVMLKEGVKPEDKVRSMEEFLQNNPTLVKILTKGL